VRALQRYYVEVDRARSTGGRTGRGARLATLTPATAGGMYGASAPAEVLLRKYG